VAGSCEYGDDPSSSGATELVRKGKGKVDPLLYYLTTSSWILMRERRYSSTCSNP
jgi:hypothetical protein